MDKLLYVAMSGAKETLRAQAANSHNLANANTTGFKADLSAFQSRAVTGPGYASRVYATDASVGWDSTRGLADHHRQSALTWPYRVRASSPSRTARAMRPTPAAAICTWIRTVS